MTGGATACFVCAGPLDRGADRPGAWLEPRTLCRAHRDALLLPGGEPLDRFLARRAPASHPLEGSALNYLINPVTVNGKRAWLDFHFEGAAAVEELFRAESYFNFLALHRPAFVDLLHAFHLLRRKEPQEDPAISLIVRLGPHAKSLTTMFELHTHQLQVDAAGRQGGDRFVASPDEAERIALSSQELPLRSSPAAIAAEFARLAPIRFAHLV